MTPWQKREATRQCLRAEIRDHESARRAANASGDAALANWWSRRIDEARAKIELLDNHD